MIGWTLAVWGLDSWKPSVAVRNDTRTRAERHLETMLSHGCKRSQVLVVEESELHKLNEEVADGHLPL